MKNEFVDAADAHALQQQLIGELMRVTADTMARVDIAALVATQDEDEVHALLMRAVDEATALFDEPLKQFKLQLAALPRSCAERNGDAPR